MVTSLLLTGSLLAWAPPPTAPDPATTTTPEELGRTRRPGKDLTFFGYFFNRINYDVFTSAYLWQGLAMQQQMLRTMAEMFHDTVASL